MTTCMEAAGGMVAARMEDTSQDRVQLKVVHTREGCIVHVLPLVVMQQDSHSHNSCHCKRNCQSRVHVHCSQHLVGNCREWLREQLVLNCLKDS